MKIKNITTRNILLSAVITILLAACKSDIIPVYVRPSDDITLSGATGDAILNSDNPQALSLTIYWSGNGELVLNNPLLQSPVNSAEETIQLSNNEQFSSTIDISVEKGVRSRQFTCEELNALVGRLGFIADEKAPLYIRIRSIIGANIEPSYSNIIKAMVQPYRIRLIFGIVLNKDWNEIGMQLASLEENGVYQGFMGVNGWTNWWLREANNVVWGNTGESGKTFYASSADNHWNFWFPDPAGCYFTTVNTQEGWWSGLHIDNLTVSGDIIGEMTYNMKANQWILPLNLTAAATVAVTVNGKGSLYNRETTDMGPAIQQNVAFGGESEKLTFGEIGSTISINLPAGETTLILDLSNPLEWRISAGTSAPEIETEPYLYFSGMVNWDGFVDYLTLYDKESLAYGGAHWIDSEWGYRAYSQPDWGTAYKAVDGATTLTGNLVLAESDGNIPAPETGLYVMDFNMKDLAYNLTKIKTVTYTGLNDNWTEQTMNQSPENPEVFSVEFIKEKETPWGVKILINNNWGLFFGGSNGNLQLGHSDATTGFDGDNSLSIGETYVLTIDLGKQEYSYTLK